MLGRASPRKPERADGGQILVAVQLAGGKALQRQQGVVVSHAAAVVRHLHQGPAAVFDLDQEPGAARVQGVFDQLLDDRCRAFDHFAGGDFIGEYVRQNSDAGHDFPFQQCRLIRLRNGTAAGVATRRPFLRATEMRLF